MKDSQQDFVHFFVGDKYIKESNERFSTFDSDGGGAWLSISRRVMKDSQLSCCLML